MNVHAPTRIVRTWHMDSRRWAGYRPREGDVIVGTYPKCGTTWTQQIVSLLLFQSPEPRAISTVAPWIDARFTVPIDKMLETIEAQSHRRSLKSHLPLDALPYVHDVRYIHVARDGLDAFMSWHNHSTRYNRSNLLDDAGLADETIAKPYPRPQEDPRDFFQSWMGLVPGTESDVSAKAFFDTERTWWAARDRPNMLFVHYNDLSANLDLEMRRIADFLKIKTPATLWPDLVHAASFEAMKRDGGALMPNAGTAWLGGHEAFLFQGRNERWRGILSEAEVELYRARAAQELTPGLALWLSHGRNNKDPRMSAA